MELLSNMVFSSWFSFMYPDGMFQPAAWITGLRRFWVQGNKTKTLTHVFPPDADMGARVSFHRVCHQTSQGGNGVLMSFGPFGVAKVDVSPRWLEKSHHLVNLVDLVDLTRFHSTIPWTERRLGDCISSCSQVVQRNHVSDIFWYDNITHTVPAGAYGRFFRLDFDIHMQEGQFLNQPPENENSKARTATFAVWIPAHSFQICWAWFSGCWSHQIVKHRALHGPFGSSTRMLWWAKRCGASLPTLGVCWNVNLRPFISFKKWARDQGKLWDNYLHLAAQGVPNQCNVSIFLSKIEESSNQASISWILIFLGIVYGGRPWTVASLWLQLVFCVQLVELEVEVTRSDLAIQTEFDLGTSWNWKSKSTTSSIVSYIFILFQCWNTLEIDVHGCEPRHLCDCAHGGWRFGRFTIDLPSVYHLPISAMSWLPLLWEVSECGMRCRWANP